MLSEDEEAEENIKMLENILDNSQINYVSEVMKQSTLKKAHAYFKCNTQSSSSQFGPAIEAYIRTNFGYTKVNASSCAGDGVKDGIFSEIKVSLGGKTHNKFNYVQIRLSHECDIYIFTAFHLSHENKRVGGDLYIFKVPKETVKRLVIAYGGYAHGTKKELGIITEESIDRCPTISYALRTTLGSPCWRELLSFRITEAEL